MIENRHGCGIRGQNAIGKLYHQRHIRCAEAGENHEAPFSFPIDIVALAFPTRSNFVATFFGLDTISELIAANARKTCRNYDEERKSRIVTSICSYQMGM